MDVEEGTLIVYRDWKRNGSLVTGVSPFKQSNTAMLTVAPPDHPEIWITVPTNDVVRTL